MSDKLPLRDAAEPLRAAFVPEWEHAEADERRRKKACQELARHMFHCRGKPAPPG